MKVRWRQHEMIFATIVAVIMLGGYLWWIFHISNQQIDAGFAAPFKSNRLPFDFYRNLIFPHIGAGLLVYLSYLFINIFTIPRFLFPKKFEAGTAVVSLSLKKIAFQGMARKFIKEFSWLILQLVLVFGVLGLGLDTSEYYINEGYFSYPGFTFFPPAGHHLQPLLDVGSGFKIAFSMMGLYGIYLIAREVIISAIERPGSRRSYRILICNQVTLILFEYLSVPLFLISFGFNKGPFALASYFWLTPLLVLVFMTNIYWLFPLKGERPFFSGPVLVRLLVSTFLSTLPFALLLLWGGVLFVWAIFLLWAAQLIIITPISWLVYQQKKDKILQLRGAQKELVKSKTDLQFLRSQINPHFLFNVLNTLYGTALQERAELTASGIQKLGDMMRFMLHENTLDFIDMTKETEYLKNYISLQKLRTQSSPAIRIEDNIRDQHCNHKIAPMLLIPFVENAFKHGISLKEESWIQINLECSEKEIRFVVRNSVHGKQGNDPEKERSGIGFKNVLERLKMIYGNKFQISVNSDGKEFLVQLSIQPLM